MPSLTPGIAPLHNKNKYFKSCKIKLFWCCIIWIYEFIDQIAKKSCLLINFFFPLQNETWNTQRNRVLKAKIMMSSKQFVWLLNKGEINYQQILAKNISQMMHKLSWYNLLECLFIWPVVNCPRLMVATRCSGRGRGIIWPMGPMSWRPVVPLQNAQLRLIKASCAKIF